MREPTARPSPRNPASTENRRFLKVSPWIDGEGVHERIWKLAYSVRHAAIAVMGLAVAVIPNVGPRRWWAVLVILGVLLPVDLGVRVWTRRHATRPALLLLVDGIAAGLVVWLAPTLFVPALFAVFASTVVGNSLYGGRAALAPGITSFVITGIVGVAAGTDNAVAIMTGATVSIIAIMVVEVFSADQRRQLVNRYATLIEGAGAVLYEVLVGDGIPLRIGPGGPEMLGVPAADITDGFFIERIHPDDLGIAIEAHAGAELLGSATVEFRLRLADGVHHWVIAHISRDPDSATTGVRLRGVIVDVSSQRGAEERSARFARLLHRVPSGVAIATADPEGSNELRMSFCNPHLAALIGRDHHWIDGKLLNVAFDFAGPENTRTIGAAVRSVIDGEAPQGRAAFVFGAGDRQYSLDTFLVGENEAAVMLKDVSGVVQKERDNRARAERDQLTGLLNRSAFVQGLGHDMAASGSGVSMVVLDLDRFKEINDAFGHDNGDRLLVEFAARLRTAFPDANAIARLGGDEFALYTSGPLNANVVQDRIRSALDDGFAVACSTLQVQATAGVAWRAPSRGQGPGPGEAEGALGLVGEAEAAMYSAKRIGQPVSAFDPAARRVDVRRLEMSAELKPALVNGEITLFYQPIIDLRTDAVVGFEGLARWLHPQRGLVPPDAFIELAEVTGLIDAMTRQMVETAIEQIGELTRAGSSAWIAVNLSVRTLHDDGFVEFVVDALTRSQVAPKRLKFEVTESGVMRDPALAKRTLEQLAAVGIGLSIDDFGTGYSSLSYLKSLPINTIKIDRSFVTDMVANENDSAIVRGTIEIAHSLNLRALAEGVEDEATAAKLAAQGCEYAQGYLYSRPIPAVDSLAWLRSRDVAELVAAVR